MYNGAITIPISMVFTFIIKLQFSLFPIQYLFCSDNL